MIYITVNKYGAITNVDKNGRDPLANGDILVELHSDVIKQIIMSALYD